MRRGTWIMFLFLSLAVVIGIGIGVMFPRVSRNGQSATTPSTGLHPGVRIEKLNSSEELFDVAGQKALVFKYSGGDLEFWIELDADGKKQVPFRKEQLYQITTLDGFSDPAPNQLIEGYFVWLRGNADDSGRENWRVAFRRYLVTTESARVQISSPFAQVEYIVSDTDRNHTGAVLYKAVQVWKGKTSIEPSAGGDADLPVIVAGDPRGWLVNTSIPSPVPTDQEVCITTITEDKGKKGEAGFEQHVIRVMCKVVSSQKKTPDMEK